MGICTRGVFPALDFTADFPPAAPGFYQRTHCVHLKNLGTTDKNLLTKSSTKRFREYIFFLFYDLYGAKYLYLYTSSFCIPL